MGFWVYMLKCRDGSYYTGHTDDLEARLWQHQQGVGADWTRRRRPVELVWCEEMPSRDDAFGAERMIKKWSVAKKEALIAGDWEKVGYFARPPHERDSTPPAQASARPERSRGALAQSPVGRPSTSLGTSDEGGYSHEERVR
ncbi:GIY-YIG nuclease family protein [Sphingosinicella sp. YJ22]|uniref:GIY-YIG nuclease family protein n=1 Tax=Sphingosinicella sp. YJ22 TaxID=1104780 RepID=UPI001A9CB200|nr:GIY-YIG nuclease family protein [Sphingosinicella sp. YJ22]